MPAVIYSEINPVTAAYSRPEGERVVVNGDVVGRAGKEKERDRERERDGAEREYHLFQHMIPRYQGRQPSS